MERPTRGIVLVFAGAVLFGTLGIFGEVAVELGVSTATFLSFRFVLATAVVWGLLYPRGRIERLGGRTLAAELGLGVVYGVMSIAYFLSLNWLSAGIAALVLYTYPVQVTAISTVLLDETLTLSKGLALVSAMAGVGLVVGVDAAEVGALGIALVVLSSVSYAVYSSASRVAVADVDPTTHSAYVFVGVTATLVPYGLVRGTLSVPATTEAWGLVAAITVVGTVVPLLLFNAGLAHIEASKASIVSTGEPLTTVLLGAALLGEALTPTVALGGAFILLGVVLTAKTPGVAALSWLRTVRGMPATDEHTDR